MMAAATSLPRGVHDRQRLFARCAGPVRWRSLRRGACQHAHSWPHHLVHRDTRVWAQAAFEHMLVAVVTTLPELGTSLAAVRLGAFDLAVGNLFDSNAVNMAAFLFTDLADAGGAAARSNRLHSCADRPLAGCGTSPPAAFSPRSAAQRTTRVRFAASLAAALLDGLFTHPAYYPDTNTPRELIAA